MEKFEIEAAKYYYAGKEKTHISIYPVIVKKTYENNKEIKVPYKINLKSAIYKDNTWRWQQIFTGEDEKMPLKTWQDVKKFVELEMKRISSILEPLFEDDKLAAWNKWKEINHSGVIIKGIEVNKNEEEEDLIERLIHGNKQHSKFVMMVLDDEDSPRNTINHWLPIWIAWKTFYERFTNDLKLNKLVKLDEDQKADKKNIINKIIKQDIIDKDNKGLKL